MSRQTHRDPVLTVDLEAVDLRVVDLIGLGRAGIGQQLRDLLRGDVLLCNDEFHVGLLFGVREPACQRASGGIYIWCGVSVHEF